MLWNDESRAHSATVSVFKPAAEADLELKLRLHRRLLDMLNLSVLERTPRDALRTELRGTVNALLAEEKKPLAGPQIDHLIEDLLDEILGLGPLEPFLKDDTITDILINGYDKVYLERGGRLERADARFLDNRHLIRIINKIVADVGRHVDESQPMVDARLPDGSRVNAIVPPLAVDGPMLSIRKFARTPITMEKLVELSSVSAGISTVLSAIVAARRNVLISGGTGSGKTTLLNALSGFIDERERIITIEDSAELQLQQPHVGRLETRPPNIEGKGEITQRELVRNALRMRPDRIIVGEVRTGEAFDMLQAMNTGHDGSMTTVHANSPRDALLRVEQMIGMAGLEISPISIRQQMASALNILLHVERSEDGRRRLVSVSELVGMEQDVILVQEIFRFRRKGRGPLGEVLGEFEPTGIRPKFIEMLAARGLKLPPDLFAPPQRVN
ncbi:MAG: type secretion system protein [Caulobacteraceae bacterium]|nr:type secretion system protein [Caulobacteraceae bacterium]